MDSVREAVFAFGVAAAVVYTFASMSYWEATMADYQHAENGSYDATLLEDEKVSSSPLASTSFVTRSASVERLQPLVAN